MSELLRDEGTLTHSRYIYQVPVLARVNPTAEPRVELSPRPTLDISFLEDLEEPELYQIVRGDRIETLAGELLGDTRWWWVIAELNPVELPDPHKMEPGTVITIPPVELIERL